MIGTLVALVFQQIVANGLRDDGGCSFQEIQVVPILSIHSRTSITLVWMLSLRVGGLICGVLSSQTSSVIDSVFCNH